MSLKNIFEMVKADRWTQDGCEALNKAREADVEDKTYQIGEISQKTGLQKTANGWRPPKGAGKAKSRAPNKADSAESHDKIGAEIKESLNAAKYYYQKAQGFSKTDPSYKTYMAKAKQYNDEAKSKADDNGFDFEEMHNTGITQAINKYAESNPAGSEGKPGRDYPILKRDDHVKLAKEVMANGDNWTTEEIAKEWKLGKADAAEVKNAIQALKTHKGVEKTLSNMEQSKPAEKTEKKSALKLPDEKSSFSTDVNRMKKLKKEDYKQYTIQLEKLHSKYPINKWQDLYNKTLNDEAPRVLTGDCKVKIKP